MTKIEEKFRELREREEGAYMPHIYYGDPNPEFSQKAIKSLASNGADFLEFGIPFSDPVADGPTFQKACDRALGMGITPETCLQGIENMRDEGLDIPIIVTAYYNIVHNYGLNAFLERLSDVEVQGIIIPDIPLEEAGGLIKSAGESKIDVILQVTQNTSKDRLKKIAESSSGFLYVVNVEGVTGARENVPQSTLKLMKSVRENVEIPLMAGFGISKEIHARTLVSGGADGIITGSALREIYGANQSNPEEKLEDLGKFANQIKKACIKGYREQTNR